MFKCGKCIETATQPSCREEFLRLPGDFAGEPEPSDVPVRMGRRQLILWLATLSAGCVTPLPAPLGRSRPDPVVVPPVRPPKLGQTWTYGVRNVFNGQPIDSLTETVLSVGDKIRIGRVSGHAGPFREEEIQGPWGMILQDPHWTPMVTFSSALPLWPQELKTGWNRDYYTRYEIPGLKGSLFDWRLSMTVLGWEDLVVGAGTFRTLKFFNHIRFQSHEFYYRLSSERMETLWFVPEIGRWAMRRSSGVYYIEGFGSRMREDDLEWSLQSMSG